MMKNNKSINLENILEKVIIHWNQCYPIGTKGFLIYNNYPSIPVTVTQSARRTNDGIKAGFSINNQLIGIVFFYTVDPKEIDFDLQHENTKI